ncbi:sigma-70 family RNA polymerase sigma factor [Amycolatopsis sp. cmx-11-12]|uniref:sigma-70 family RNA polymerase sigma factor n=1 Tax=Amycolatopsis sp. cmx-11-12 TaxID=2785795 RepID=UPI0039184AB2
MVASRASGCSPVRQALESYGDENDQNVQSRAVAPIGETQGQDSRLIVAVRNGNVAAYGELYERHVASARNLARQLSRSTMEADDLVAEAFDKVLRMLCKGRGPDSALRPYLLAALRHTAYDKMRKDRKVQLSGSITSVVDHALASAPFNDTVINSLERSFAAKAFARLPERWQAVLWNTEVDGKAPADIAREFGLTANGVSALAYRAREGLRQAYLQVHLTDGHPKLCRPSVERLGAWTRDGLDAREARQVEVHLAHCRSCRGLAEELAEINSALWVGRAAKRSRVRAAMVGGPALAEPAG